MNPVEEKVRSDVKTLGWHIILVGPSDQQPAFAYTIGLFHNHRHPEVIVFGLPDRKAHEVLNVVGMAVNNGARFEARVTTGEILKGNEVAFIDFPGSAYPAHLGYAMLFYGGDGFPAVQLVWPDAAGRFPWDEGVAQSAHDSQRVVS